MNTNTKIRRYPHSVSQSKPSVDWLDFAGTDVAAKLKFGDHSGLSPDLASPLLLAKSTFSMAVRTIGRLAQDETRSEVSKNIAAKKLAQKTGETLKAQQTALRERAAFVRNQAMSKADREFAPKEGRAALESEIRAHIKAEMQTPNGLANIRALAKSNHEVASVIYHSPNFLLGLKPDLHEEIKYDALQKWHTDIYREAAQAVHAEKMADKFDSVIDEVNNNFYEPHLADKLETRVEV